MTFVEIAQELNISPQRAQQIYVSALNKANAIAKREGVSLEEVVAELEEGKTMFEHLEEGLMYDLAEEDDLRGFWKEENNKRSSI